MGHDRVTAENPVAQTDEPETMLGNLPIQLTTLLGRAEEVIELEAMVWRTRLLTLSGPGGVGKSRLAMDLAEAVRADFIGGAWWADLADGAEDARVAQTVAAAVMPGEQLNDPAAAVARLVSSSSLLVLDNCDQVVAGVARLVADLLARAPALRVIVTSRQPLGIGGEQVWRVPGLAIDGAVALFAHRAQESAGGLDLQATGVRESVAEICELLDGLPLAVELAALRVSVLSVEQIAERLGQTPRCCATPAAPHRGATARWTTRWSGAISCLPRPRSACSAV